MNVEVLHKFLLPSLDQFQSTIRAAEATHDSSAQTHRPRAEELDALGYISWV